MNIGDIIKCKRQKKNMTQAELAEKLKVTPQAVSRWEMGISYPDIAMVPLISGALWVSADELLGIIPSHENRKDGDLYVRASDLVDFVPAYDNQKDGKWLKSEENSAPVLNQSQVDSIFDHVPVPLSGESKKVLVVDDANFMRMMLEDILTKQGHTVLQARNGQECLDALLDEAIDVCVLDINMPGMDGLEVLKRIKKGKPGLKVVMLSALSQESNVELALQLGADAFVVKPFAAQCLIERVG